VSWVGTPGRCALVGMVHLRPLPGSPGWDGDMAGVLSAAEADASALLAGGCDALIVENMGDLPYLRGRVDPETVAAMTLATHAVVRHGAPTGVQVLAGANREALGVAVAAGARFLRVEAFAYAHIADEGWLEACAGELLRARRALGCDVSIWADVQKKHAAHALTADLTVAALAEGHRFCGADALIVTGASTGHPTDPDVLAQALTAGLPVAVGSGVTPANAASLRAAAALIVGSYLKEDGDWRRPVDVSRVRAVRAALDG
jgi:membrane complex biogenesis BtpA family protein